MSINSADLERRITDLEHRVMIAELAIPMPNLQPSVQAMRPKVLSDRETIVWLTAELTRVKATERARCVKAMRKAFGSAAMNNVIDACLRNAETAMREGSEAFIGEK